MRREAGKGGQRLSGEQKEPWTRNGETPLLILALLFHGVTSGGHRAFLDSIFSSTKWGGGSRGFSVHQTQHPCSAASAW